MSISANSASDETLNRGPLALLLRRQYEFPFGISIMQFSFFFPVQLDNICLFQALDDIQYAIKMLKQGDKSENPVDRHYHNLSCDLSPLDHTSDDFKVRKVLCLDEL